MPGVFDFLPSSETLTHILSNLFFTCCTSMFILKTYVEIEHPILTPLSILNDTLSPSLTLTQTKLVTLYTLNCILKFANHITSSQHPPCQFPINSYIRLFHFPKAYLQLFLLISYFFIQFQRSSKHYSLLYIFC